MRRFIMICAGILLCCCSVLYAASPEDINCFDGSASSIDAPKILVSSDSAEIRIKKSAIVGGMLTGDTLYAIGDGIVKFPFEYINRYPNGFNLDNGFKIYSPDGATWEMPYANGGNYRFSPSTAGMWLDTTGYFPKSHFGALYKFNAIADGIASDSFMFGGAANDASQTALRPLDSGIFFWVSIRLKASDVRKHIVIDTGCFPPCHCWKWPSFGVTPAFNVFPNWPGPYTFVIGGCCRGLSGNYDCSPDDRVDISDIAAAVDRYTTFAMPCCPGEANVDGSPDGVADISDLSRLIDYLFISFTPPEPCR